MYCGVYTHVEVKYMTIIAQKMEGTIGSILM